MKQWRLLTLYSFDTYAATTDEDRLKSIHLARKMLCTKKVDIYMWLPLLCSVIYYCTPHRCSLCCVVHRHSSASGLPHDAMHRSSSIVTQISVKRWPSDRVKKNYKTNIKVRYIMQLSLSNKVFRWHPLNIML